MNFSFDLHIIILFNSWCKFGNTRIQSLLIENNVKYTIEDRLITPSRGKHNERIRESVRCRQADKVLGTHISIRGDATYVRIWITRPLERNIIGERNKSHRASRQLLNIRKTRFERSNLRTFKMAQILKPIFHAILNQIWMSIICIINLSIRMNFWEFQIFFRDLIGKIYFLQIVYNKYIFICLLLIEFYRKKEHYLCQDINVSFIIFELHLTQITLK